MQRFEPRIPGVGYKITEHPARGEYRFVRFAWRTDACTGIMLQLHNTDWNIRYVAGTNEPAWVRSRWRRKRRQALDGRHARPVRRFRRSTIHGIAFTAFGHEPGNAAWFDHVYFGRTLADLDGIDVTEAVEHPAPLDEKVALRSLVRHLLGQRPGRLSRPLPHPARRRACGALSQAVCHRPERLRG